MKTCEDFGTGKTRENFPVASRLIAPRLRAPILAYYRFARAADDVADHPRLEPATKFELLDGLQATLLGTTDRDPAALPLRAQLRERALSPEHALDVLTAFRLDVTKHRYRDWDELMHYCRYSAMPVGRFVLELHDESRATWEASDALCSALQVINHLQDCAKDYAELDRVYVPLDALEGCGTSVEALAATSATPELRACLQSVARRAGSLLPQAAQLPHVVKDLRLGIETAVIVAVADKLTGWLLERDPLSQRVHLRRPEALWLTAAAVIPELLRRLHGAPGQATRRGGA